MTGKSPITLTDRKRERVKVLVYTFPEDGYPPEEWESLWAEPLGDRRFRIDSIPFYAKDLSFDDIVQADKEDGFYVLKDVIEYSPNSTIRVLIYDLQDEPRTRRCLRDIGCGIEGSGIAGLLAIDVPKTLVAPTLHFLEDEFRQGRLEFEHGRLR